MNSSNLQSIFLHTYVAFFPVILSQYVRTNFVEKGGRGGGGSPTVSPSEVYDLISSITQETWVDIP